MDVSDFVNMVQRPETDSQFLCWVSTYHFGLSGQPSDIEAKENLTIFAEEHCDYLIAGSEVAPSTGSRHYQIYFKLKKKNRLSGLKKLLPGAWFQNARGSAAANYDYCSKQGDWFEVGELSETAQKAEQNKWDHARDAAMNGDILEVDSRILISHYNSLRSIQKDFLPDVAEASDVTGVWFYGESGAGKSRRAIQEFPGAYRKNANKWWDGYDPKKHVSVILDDFGPVHSVLGYHLKIWADRYPFIAETKGGSLFIRPQAFVVTSQYHPHDIWSDSETRDAIDRRFKVTRIGLPRDAPAAMKDFVAPTPGGFVTPRPANKRDRLPSGPVLSSQGEALERAKTLVLSDSDDEEEPQPSKYGELAVVRHLPAAPKKVIVDLVESDDDTDEPKLRTRTPVPPPLTFKGKVKEQRSAIPDEIPISDLPGGPGGKLAKILARLEAKLKKDEERSQRSHSPTEDEEEEV